MLGFSWHQKQDTTRQLAAATSARFESSVPLSISANGNGTVALICGARTDAVECSVSSGLNQSRDELHLRKDTWLFDMDVTAFDGPSCFYAAQGRLS